MNGFEKQIKELVSTKQKYRNKIRYFSDEKEIQELKNVSTHLRASIIILT